MTALAFDGEAAARIGFADRVASDDRLDGVTEELVERLAALPEHGVASVKAFMRERASGTGHLDRLQLAEFGSALATDAARSALARFARA